MAPIVWADIVEVEPYQLSFRYSFNGMLLSALNVLKKNQIKYNDKKINFLHKLKYNFKDHKLPRVAMLQFLEN